MRVSIADETFVLRARALQCDIDGNISSLRSFFFFSFIDGY